MRRYFPDFEQFKLAAQDAEVIPVYRQLLADRLTPVSAFEVLGREPHAFLLESVVGGEKIGRYSFIAAGPSLVYQAAGGKAVIDEPVSHRMRSGRSGAFDTADPLADLHALFPRRKYHQSGALPAFTGGLVGYAGYDTIRYYEGEKLTAPPKDDRRIPDVLFGLYHELVIFDHVDKTIKVVANAQVGDQKVASNQWPVADGDPGAVGSGENASIPYAGHRPLITDDSIEAAYRDACRRTDEIVARLQQPPTSKLGEIDPPPRCH